MFEVEVDEAMPDKKILLRLEVPDGTTAMEAIRLSGIKRSFPEMVIEAGVIGIFSQKVPLDQLLKAGDQLFQIGGGIRYWVDGPDGGPEGWGFRLQVTLLFPR